MKKIISLLLSLIILAGSVLLSSCTQSYTDPTANIKADASQDKYRNFYEIFVGSFCDSDNDGVGDIKGIISKLDYLNDGDPTTDTDLGVDGIWLTPVMPSHSYHKYDVKDYFNIDKSFGTLADFDELVSECHKRGIKLVIDMVLNHSSKFLPMFEKACKQALKGNLKDYAKYFEIKKYKTNPGDSYTSIGKGYYYESNFSPYMPEWNLSQKCTREYFLKIAKFWLNNHNVDGFRLDACKYYDSDDTKGQEFLKWYYSAVQKIKSDVYMVGEMWTGSSEIEQLYKSQIDSLFAFSFAGVDSPFVNAVRSQNGSSIVSSLMKYQRETLKSNKNVINAYFLSNHDQVRSGNYLKLTGESGIKMAAATYMLVPGNSYIYYGEEIGTTQDSQGDGDEYKRGPMIWDTKNLPDIKVNNIVKASKDQAKYGGVTQQFNEDNSILSFYKRIIKIKNQNPDIARGKITGSQDFNDSSICAYYIEYGSNKLMIVHNFSNSKSKELKITDKMLSNPELRGDLVASNTTDKDATVNYISFENNTLSLPAQSTAILKQD